VISVDYYYVLSHEYPELLAGMHEPSFRYVAKSKKLLGNDFAVTIM